MTHTVKALVKGNNITADQVAAYLPSNYSVIGEYESKLTHRHVVVIEGIDHAGWTFTDYVQPRLASGLMFADEIIEGIES